MQLFMHRKAWYKMESCQGDVKGKGDVKFKETPQFVKGNDATTFVLTSDIECLQTY